MWALTLTLCVISFVVYKYLNRNYGYWHKLGVPHPAVNTFFGNLKDSFLMKRCVGEIFTDIYNQFSNCKYVGYYKMRTPGIVIRDPELVMDVLNKDFNSFHDNDVEVDEKIDPLMSKSPFVQRGEKWKSVRNKLSPCFSSAKIKILLPTMLDVSEELTSYIQRESVLTKKPLEAKELAAKFTMNNIAMCAFGLNGDAFTNPKSEFRANGRRILEVSFFVMMKFLCISFLPQLAAVLKIKFIPDSIANYFKNIIHNTLEHRKKNNIIRNDFLDMLTDLKSKSVDDADVFTDEDVLGHSMGFLVDGFETTSIVISFALFLLAQNPECQQNLREEIETALKQSNGGITFEELNQMKFLDCIINETLRMYPPGMTLVKVCTARYILPPHKERGKSIVIEPGTPVVIPVYGLQMDKKYHKIPDKFNPSRFEDKDNIIKGTYLPFGSGARMCLGFRLALLQAKVAIFAVISKFFVTVNEKTKIPIEFDPKYFMIVAKGGLWLDYKSVDK